MFSQTIAIGKECNNLSLQRFLPDSHEMMRQIGSFRNDDANVDGVVLYFCTTVRTVWQNGRARTYTPNSLYTSLKNATLYAETIRKSGTTFRVQQLPALRISTGNHNVLLTQINETCPFRGFPTKDLKILSSDGISLERLLDSLKPTSLGWKNPIPKDNSILFLTSNETIYERLKVNRKYYTFASYFDSGELWWDKLCTDTKSASAVWRIIRLLNAPISTAEIDD